MTFPRRDRNVFRNLCAAIIAFGFSVGLVFPPFARLVLGTDRALSPYFFMLCICAGLTAGLVNYLLFGRVVSSELERINSLGCEYGQGYLSSKPLPAPQVAAFIARRAASVAVPVTAPPVPAEV